MARGPTLYNSTLALLLLAAGLALATTAGLGAARAQRLDRGSDAGVDGVCLGDAACEAPRAVPTPAGARRGAPPGVYDVADRLYRQGAERTSELRREVSRVAAENHSRLSYGEVWTALMEIDTVAGDGRVRTVYSGDDFPENARSGQSERDSRGRQWNREHVWAKSHGFPRRGQWAYTDLHHLRPSDSRCNSHARGSRDFAELDGSLASVKTWTECGGAKSTPARGHNTKGFFEPPDAVKGDVARAMLYMDVRYNGRRDGSRTPDLRLVAGETGESGTPTFGDLCTLLRWHLASPPTARELDEHEARVQIQGNRNPFVDRPEYAALLFGGQCGLVVPPPAPDQPAGDAARPSPPPVVTEVRRGADWSTPEKARAWAHRQAKAGHRKLGYSPGVWRALMRADEDVEDESSVRCVLTGLAHDKADRSGHSDAPFEEQWNREHLWPKSHGAGRGWARTDVHHVRASNAKVNGCHSHFDWGTAEGGGACGGVGESIKARVARVGGGGTFEPPDEVKGEVARALLYVDVRYEGDAHERTSDLRLVDEPTDKDGNELGHLCQVLQWHLDNPVTVDEAWRHDRRHEVQGNRNPFVDHPKLATAVFGHRCGVQ